MPIFSYTAKDLSGTTHKGDIDTVDEHQAAAILRRKRLIITSLQMKNPSGEKLWEKFFNRVPFNDVVVMTRQLATMISAGLVLSEALDILQEQQTNVTFKKVLTDISDDVKGGLDFATALEKYPAVFPPLYSKLIRAGQASGKMDNILNQLADNLEKDRQFRSRVTGAMIYPAIILTMMAGVMLIMVFFVMPKLLGLYSQSGLDLPITTKIMIGFADFMIGYWWAVALILAALIIGGKRYISTDVGRRVFDEVLLRMPVIGRLVRLVTMTNFVRTFALLTASGVPILDSIKIVSGVVGNEVFRKSLEDSYKGVERGLTFSSQLLSMPVFPKIVGQMIKTGEETGKLDEVMFKLADYFQSESDESLKNVSTLIEPIIIVVLGLGVAFMVISIILPIYQLTTNIQ